MSKRVYLSGNLKRKLKSQRVVKEKSLPRISAFLNKDSFSNDSSLSRYHAYEIACGNN